jgi:spore coat protein U-like protein
MDVKQLISHRARRRPRLPRRPAAPLACAALLAPLAQAAPLGTNCSATATPVSFGIYNPLTPSPLNSTGIVTVSCSAIFPGTVTATVDLSPGSSGSFVTRHMVGGASALNYNLYQDAAETLIWGDGTGSSLAETLSVTIPGFFGSGQARGTVYGQMPALQDVAPATYIDTVTVTVNY